MPAIGSIKTSTLAMPLARTSSATVSYDKTFDPEGIDSKGVARWVDRSSGIAVGFPNLSLSMRKPTQGSRVYKLTGKLLVPTLEVTAPTTVTGIQPQPTKAYDHGIMWECLLPERGTQAERLVLFNLWHSLMLTTINASDDAPTDATLSPLLAMVSNLDSVY